MVAGAAVADPNILGAAAAAPVAAAGAAPNMFVLAAAGFPNMPELEEVVVVVAPPKRAGAAVEAPNIPGVDVGRPPNMFDAGAVAAVVVGAGIFPKTLGVALATVAAVLVKFPNMLGAG